MNPEEIAEIIRTNGYAIIPSLLTDKECDIYKKDLEKNFTLYRSHYATSTSSDSGLSDKSTEKVVFNLHNKGTLWATLFDKKEILAVLDIILREGSYNNVEPYYLYNISARSPLKGFAGQQLHIDSNLPGNNYCLIANVIWMLDDFTLENGATRVVPGSHKWITYPSNGEIHPDEVRIVGSKGSALIFDANLWHGGAENMTNGSRWAVALGYSRWFIKPSFDFMKNTPVEIFDRLTDSQKEILGFKLIPPADEFIRLRRRSSSFEKPDFYQLPHFEK
jgi:ectoine hydroxylase-related dioxygenase (phytanoyl-CoA dioxygenase family)